MSKEGLRDKIAKIIFEANQRAFVTQSTLGDTADQILTLLREELEKIGVLSDPIYKNEIRAKLSDFYGLPFRPASQDIREQLIQELGDIVAKYQEAQLDKVKEHFRNEGP